MVNPITEFAGGQFLLFYAGLIGATVALCRWWSRLADPTVAVPVPPVPSQPDPYEVAYLVTGHVLSRRSSHAIRRLISRILSPLAPDGVKGRDRILVCVGTAGIPAAESRNPFGAPGKNGRAVVAFDSPGPPLGSFTKEMQAFRFPCFRKGQPSRARW